jgi:hypothetical protein
LPVLSSSHFLISWYSLGEVEQLEIDLAKSKASEEEIRFKYREADIKLNALQDYFKNMESDLHRYAELYFLLLRVLELGRSSNLTLSLSIPLNPHGNKASIYFSRHCARYIKNVLYL